MIEVEYNRENLGGSTEYLRWIKGTIAAWNKSKGYLVNSEDGDQEWLPSVEEKNVRLLWYIPVRIPDASWGIIYIIQQKKISTKIKQL